MQINRSTQYLLKTCPYNFYPDKPLTNLPNLRDRLPLLL